MSWNRRSLEERFGIELSGRQIGSGLSPADRNAVYEATVRYGVTVIRGQQLGDGDLRAFLASLPDPLFELRIPNGPAQRAPGVVPLSNLDAKGEVLPASDANVQQNRANELWHTDLTFQKPRATLSLLYARVVPAAGGNTEFCDTRLLWEQLDEAERDHLASLTCMHSGAHSRRKYGFTDWVDNPPDYPPVERPLITVQPGTGRVALTLGAYVESILGMTQDESQALIDGLIERAAIPAHVYVHRWKAGDLLLWDNRCMIHRARPFNLAEPRDMRAARLFDPATP